MVRHLTMSTVAVHLVDIDIRCIRLWREAVVTDIHPHTFYREVTDVLRVEEVGVGRVDRSIVRLGGGDDVLVVNANTCCCK